jgi:hypothetical protein
VQDRGRGGQVGHHAPGPADRRLERLARGRLQRALGVGEQLLSLVQAATEQRQEGADHQQPRPRAHDLGRHDRQPSGQGGLLGAMEGRVEVPLDEAGRPAGVPRGQGVPDGVLGRRPLAARGRALAFPPGGRGAMQLGDTAGQGVQEPRLQQVGEQPVIAPPAADVVERDQEQVGPLDPLQQRLAVAAAGDRLAQRPAHLV